MENKQLNNEANTATPYDDVYRTLLNDCTSLIIPVVNDNKVFQGARRSWKDYGWKDT